MNALAYYAMTDMQIAQLIRMLDGFSLEPSKHKRLLEVRHTFHHLGVFERQTNGNVYCIRKDLLSQCEDVDLAMETLSRSFRGRVVEFL